MRSVTVTDAGRGVALLVTNTGSGWGLWCAISPESFTFSHTGVMIDRSCNKIGVVFVTTCLLAGIFALILASLFLYDFVLNLCGPPVGITKTYDEITLVAEGNFGDSVKC